LLPPPNFQSPPEDASAGEVEVLPLLKRRDSEPVLCDEVSLVEEALLLRTTTMEREVASPPA
jgi:hypothetical protein